MVVTKVEEKSCLLRNNGGENSVDQSNFVIRDLALATESNISNTEIDIDLVVNYQVLLVSENTYEIKILSADLLTQPLKYKDFNVSPWICPSEVQLEIMISDTLGVPLKLIHGVLIPGESQIESFSLNRTYSKLNSEIIKVKCLINENSYEHFNDGLLLINNYYAASQALDVIRTNLEHGFEIRHSPIERSFEFVEAIRTIGFIQSQDFTRLQSLTVSDPARLNEKLRRLAPLMTKYRTLLAKELSAAVNYSIPVNATVINYLNKAQNRFSEIKFNYDHRYTYFFDQLARVNYTNSYLGKIFRLVAESNPLKGSEPDRIRPLIYFAKHLVLSNIETAQNLAAGQDFISALKLLDKTKALCESVPSLECPESLYALVSQCETGIFSAYLGIAERAVTGRQYNLAAEYLQKAKYSIAEQSCDYCNHMINQVADATLNGFIEALSEISQNETFYLKANALLGKIKDFASEFSINDNQSKISQLEQEVVISGYNHLIKEFRTNIESGHLLEAELVLDEICALPANLDEQEIINSQNILDQKFYSHYFNFGKSFLEYDKPELALDYFQMATFYTSSLDEASLQMFNFYLNYAAEDVCHRLLERASQMLDRCDADSYYLYYDRACELAVDYALLGVDDIACSFQEAENLNDSCYCITKDRELVNLRRKIDRLIAAGNYQGASNTAQTAILCSSDAAFCNLDTDYFREKVNILEKAISYKFLVESKVSLLPDHPTEFIQQYEEIETFYNNYNLVSIEVPYNSYSHYLEMINNTDTLRMVINHLINENHPEDAMKMLTVARNKNIDPDEFYYEQLLLGSVMSNRDYKTDSMRNPYYNLDEYTKNEKWYAVFREKYLESWSFYKTGVESTGFAIFIDEFSYIIKYKSKKVWQSVSSFSATLLSRVNPTWSGLQITL